MLTMHYFRCLSRADHVGLPVAGLNGIAKQSAGGARSATVGQHLSIHTVHKGRALVDRRQALAGRAHVGGELHWRGYHHGDGDWYQHWRRPWDRNNGRNRRGRYGRPVHNINDIVKRLVGVIDRPDGEDDVVRAGGAARQRASAGDAAHGRLRRGCHGDGAKWGGRLKRSTGQCEIGVPPGLGDKVLPASGQMVGRKVPLELDCSGLHRRLVPAGGGLDVDLGEVGATIGGMAG
jgi:hypothetical protein